MKSLFKSLALVAFAIAAFCLCAPPAQAQAPIFNAQTLLTSSTVTNGTTRTYGTTGIDVGKQAYVSIVTTVTGAGADTGAVTFTLQRSHDNTNFETTGTTIAVTSNGTNTVRTITKVDSNGAGYIRLATVQNAATNNVAVTLGWALKINAP